MPFSCKNISSFLLFPTTVTRQHSTTATKSISSSDVKILSSTAAKQMRTIYDQHIATTTTTLGTLPAEAADVFNCGWIEVRVNEPGETARVDVIAVAERLVAVAVDICEFFAQYALRPSTKAWTPAFCFCKEHVRCWALCMAGEAAAHQMPRGMLFVHLAFGDCMTLPR